MKKQTKRSKIVPVGERVLLKPISEESDRIIGRIKIVLPEKVTQEKSDQGVVVAVGESKKVKVGDRVVFSKYGYDEVSLDGEEYYLVKEENILAIIK